MDRWLFNNGVIYTLTEEKKSYNTMLVENGVIEKVFESDPHYLEIPQSKVVDLQGHAVIPSFTDCHFHFMPTVGLYEMALNVSEYVNGKIQPDNIFDVGEKVKKFGQTRDPKKPILCFNYIIKAVKEDRLPYKDEIDSWLGPERFVMFISMDGHSSSYSSKALKYMGIDSQHHDGILSGEQHEFNMGKIADLVFENMSASSLIRGLSHLVNDMIKSGITAVHALDGISEDKPDLSLKILYMIGGILPLDFYLYPQIKNFDFIQQLRKRMRYPKVGGCNGWEMDGSIGSRTAAFEIPYFTDPNNYGKLYFDQSFVDSEVKRYHDQGYQIISHAIGTLAIERILSAYEKVINNKDQDSRKTKNTHRHRIEHFEFPNKEQVDRIIENDILVSAQPGYAYFDYMFQKSYRAYLSPEIFNRQIPLKTITERGGYILGSSDSPIQYHNPFIQIAGMVKFPLANERISIFQALRTYTVNAAYATFEEHQKGTLEPGMKADFIVLDRNPFHIKSEEIEMIKVKETFINGLKPKYMSGSVASLLGKLIFRPKKKI